MCIRDRGKSLLLPVDAVVAKAFPSPIDAEIEVEVFAADSIPVSYTHLDVYKRQPMPFTT